jgi:hypothetical protein
MFSTVVILHSRAYIEDLSDSNIAEPGAAPHRRSSLLRNTDILQVALTFIIVGVTEKLFVIILTTLGNFADISMRI